MISTANQKFLALDWYNADGGTSFLPGAILDKYKFVQDIAISKTTPNKRLQFNSGTKTITNANNIDFDSFIDLGYVIGEKIKFSFSGANGSTTFTITDISDRVITVAESVTTYTAESSTITLHSAVTSIDYYFNLTNVAPAARRQPLPSPFNSRTDNGTLQKYTASGLDASDTVTIVPFKIATDSYGWYADDLDGSSINSSVVGLGFNTDSGIQTFRITHYFFQTPFFLKELFQNWLNKIAPNEYQAGNSLSYLYQIDAKYSVNSPSVPNTTGIVIQDGANCWLNQNDARSRVLYTLVSTKYFLHSDESSLDRLDINTSVDVEIKIKSIAGKFLAGTKFVLNYLYCPMAEVNYQNTPTTLRQNYIHDRALLTIGAPDPVPGEFYATDWGVITNALATRVDDNNATINFTFEYSAAMKSFMKLQGDQDHNYAIVVTTQDKNIESSSAIDRVPVWCDFQNADYDQREPSLLSFKDYIRVYSYPDFGKNPKKDATGYEGTSMYAEVPFQIETSVITPTIKTAGMEIVAIKTGEDDFILEEFSFNASQVCGFNKVQQLNLTQSRGYKTFDGDPYNQIYLIADSDYDNGTKKGYLLHYAFILRYDFWNKIFISNQSNCPPIQKDVQELNNRWLTIGNGWSLKLRFKAEVIGTNDFVTPFQGETAINIKNADAAPDAGPTFTKQIIMLDENGYVVNSVVQGGTTKVIIVFTGDFNNLPAGTDSLEGSITADVQNQFGGANNRRQASSNLPSEADSPWSDPGPNPDASSSWANGNARINLFTDGDGNAISATLESIYTDVNTSFGNGSNRCGQIIIGGSVIFTQQTERQFSDATPHLWSDTSPANWK